MTNWDIHIKLRDLKKSYKEIVEDDESDYYFLASKYSKEDIDEAIVSFIDGIGVIQKRNLTVRKLL